MPSVQRVRWAKIRVIMTAVAALIIMATLVALLTGGTLFQQQSQLFLYIPDATGLEVGSPVRVDGIRVGKVGSVGLSGSSQPNRVVRLTLIIEQGHLQSIAEDSTAQPAADTLVGDKFIQISSGTKPQRARAGAEITYKGSPDLVTSLDLSQFRKNMEEMDQLLTGIETGQSPLGQFVIKEDMYRDVLKRATELQHGIHAAANTTSAIGHELYTDELYQQVSARIRPLDDALARLQSGQGNLGRMLHDDAQYQQALDQLVALRKSFADMRKMELLTRTDMHDQLSRNISVWIRMVDEFNQTPAMTTPAAYENLNGMAKELQGDIKDFRENPKKFLRMKLF
jgi:phospholipid/cholesterol/gamma-HCH transport system substrate-binding protein